MNARLKQALGLILGIVTMIFAARHFLYTYRDGNPSWFMVVMVFGMLLIIYYHLVSKRKHDDEDYS